MAKFSKNGKRMGRPPLEVKGTRAKNAVEAKRALKQVQRNAAASKIANLEEALEDARNVIRTMEEDARMRSGLLREADQAISKQRAQINFLEQRVAWYKRKSTAQARAWTINARKLSVANGMAMMMFDPEPVNFLEEPPSMIPRERPPLSADDLVGRRVNMKLETKSANDEEQDT